MGASEHQLKRYIIYTCKKCGWQTAVLKEWGDLKPTWCLGKKGKCKVHFPTNKYENLLTKKPLSDHEIHEKLQKAAVERNEAAKALKASSLAPKEVEIDEFVQDLTQESENERQTNRQSRKKRKKSES